jgi:hypothetical protein
MHGFMLAAAFFVAGGPVPGADRAPDLSGTWQYQTSKHWKRGVCPTGGPRRGKLAIQKKGKRFTLVIQSGSTCRPASMCRYAGTVRGRVWTASNQARVDSEGGVVRNELVLQARSKTRATGTVKSSYTHPGGMRCAWGFRITLTRKAR